MPDVDAGARRASALPRARGHGQRPGADGRRALGRLPRLPRPALERARADEGRHPLRPARLARRVRGARDVDDLEVRAPAAAVRRRQGRRPLHTRGRCRSDEVQRLTRRFTSSCCRCIGPQTDIPAPDMATNEQTMAWMMDTYSMQVGYAVPEIVTGKPISIGGSVFRQRGDRRRRRDGDRARVPAPRLEPSPSSGCVVQGFGNVGGVAARELAARGAKVVAVSDISGGDLPTERARSRRMSRAWVAEHGSLADYPDASTSRTRELLELPCDILVLAALEEQITAENAGRARHASSSPRARTGRRRSRRTRSSPSAGSSSSPTCSRTRAASPSPTSSGCRTSAGSSGTATRSAPGSPTS